jgi:hypothetical protein
MKGEAMDPKLQLAELAKAGAKFSKETKAAMSAHADHLDKMHKAMKECTSMCKEACDKMDAMMPKDDGDGENGDGKDGDDKDKAAKAAAAAALAAAASTTAAKEPTAEEQAAAFAKVIADAIEAKLEPLRKQVEIIARQPAGGMPIASQAAADALKKAGLTVVDRAADGGDDGQQGIQPVRGPGGQIDPTATLMKMQLDPSRAKTLVR